MSTEMKQQENKIQIKRLSVKHGIKYCVMSRLIAIVLIVLISFTLVSYFAMQSILEANIAKRGSYDAQKNQIQIEKTLDEIFNLYQLLSLNTDIRSFLSTEQHSSPTQKVLAVNDLMSQLNENVLLGNYIHSYCIVDSEGTSYWNLCPYDDYFITWFRSYALDGKKLSKQVGFTKSYFFPNNQQRNIGNNLIGYVSNINEVKDTQLNTLGQIIINLNISALMEDVWTQSSLFSQIGILDENNRVIYLTEGEMTESEFQLDVVTLQSSFEKRNNGYYFVNPLSNVNWKLVSFLSEGQMMEDSEIPFLAIATIIIILAIFLIFLFIFPVLMNLSKQIVHLDHAIEQVGNGNLNVSIKLQGTKELTNIGNGFNRMVIKTKQYMKDALKNLEEKQKVSFELLLAKINPHFIYNTLNSVIYLARQNRNQDVIQLTSAFIYLLQDSIHLEENSLFAQTSTEVEVIEKYITIQKYRYANQFQFKCVFDSELKDTCIPKNILQPLIENAIIHGICPSEVPGHIELNLKKENDHIRILIMDDGVGMEPELAKQLTDCTTPERIKKKSSQMRAIGLRNIAEKLQFIYHDNYEFTITSDPSYGTLIRIVLPVRTKEDVQLNHFTPYDTKNGGTL
jgi:two-component system sensor histidine kinase YesM